MAIVAIVGRPNVGKSTLFNRLTKSRDAIVTDVAGTTRDRHYGKTDWNGKEFSIIDTGGYILGSDDIFEDEIRKQVQIAIEESSAIIFMVDAQEGLSDIDKDVAALLRRNKKPVFLVANKVDNPSQIGLAAEFYTLGLGEVYHLSSISGSGTGDFLDALVEKLPDGEQEEDLTNIPRIAIVGRPNVGKSSILNLLTGEERNIVTPIAGTTRDAVDTRYKGFGFDCVLIDTAGLRKKRKVEEDLEFYSVMRTVKAIESSDVCILVIDAVLGFESQDMNIFRLAERNHKGILIVVNKWDLVEKDHKTMKQFENSILEKIKPFDDVPIIFTSAITKQRVLKALEEAVRIYNKRSEKLNTRKLNDLMLPIIEQTPPPAWKGKYIKIKFIQQLPTYYPSFAFFCNLPQYIREPYKRFVENKLRENFDYKGVPIEIYFRQK
jgi:GTP-binding protein